jgi:hypothetical protein
MPISLAQPLERDFCGKVPKIHALIGLKKICEVSTEGSNGGAEDLTSNNLEDDQRQIVFLLCSKRPFFDRA